MNQRIIYPNDENGLSIVIPTGAVSLEELIARTVPQGVPYRVVDVSDIPTDRTFRDAWEADFSNPDGYSIGEEAWFAEQEAKQIEVTE
jgi:hypothetical protein